MAPGSKKRRQKGVLPTLHVEFVCSELSPMVFGAQNSEPLVTLSTAFRPSNYSKCSAYRPVTCATNLRS